MIERPSRDDESGAALVIVLIAATLVAALALAAIVVSETEQRIEASFVWTLQARSAAEAGATRVVADLATVPDWSTTLGGDPLGPLDTGSRITTPSGQVVDLAARGAEIQADSDARAAGAVNRPIWRRVESGPLAMLVGSTSSRMLDYVAVWIADDWWELDDNPTADSNGVVMIHAEAWGSGGARAAVEATIAHGVADPTCGATASSDYVSGEVPGSARVRVALFARRWGSSRSGIVLAGWQGSSPSDPCHLRGPGAVIVTWREMS